MAIGSVNYGGRRFPLAYPYGTPYDIQQRNVSQLSQAVSDLFTHAAAARARRIESDAFSSLSQAGSPDEVRAQLAGLQRARSGYLDRVLGTSGPTRIEQAVTRNLLEQALTPPPDPMKRQSQLMDLAYKDKLMGQMDFNRQQRLEQAKIDAAERKKEAETEEIEAKDRAVKRAREEEKHQLFIRDKESLIASRDASKTGGAKKTEPWAGYMKQYEALTKMMEGTQDAVGNITDPAAYDSLVEKRSKVRDKILKTMSQPENLTNPMAQAVRSIRKMATEYGRSPIGKAARYVGEGIRTGKLTGDRIKDAEYLRGLDVDVPESELRELLKLYKARFNK